MEKDWAAQFVASMSASEFKMVEIEPLLTFHYMVDLERSSEHCKAIRENPDVADLLPLCLPDTFVHEPINMVRLPDGKGKQLSGGSILLSSKSLKIRVIDAGYFQNDNKIGIQFAMPVPLVQVVRFNGRCYLHDGLHRTMGARLKGATHIPCLFRDVHSAANIGLQRDGSTFLLQLLEFADPPTVGHFVHGRAYKVQLKRFSRIIHVTWGQYGIADE